MHESNGQKVENALLHLAVTDAVTGFAVASDQGDRAAMAKLITEDFVVHIPGQGVTRGPGRTEFLDFAVETTAARRARGEAGRHLVTNVQVERTPDRGDGAPTARARSYITFIVITPDGASAIQGFASYDDQLVSLAGRWQLATRTIRFAHEDLASKGD